MLNLNRLTLGTFLGSLISNKCKEFARNNQFGIYEQKDLGIKNGTKFIMFPIKLNARKFLDLAS